jgi:hypothetical protein
MNIGLHIHELDSVASHFHHTLDLIEEGNILINIELIKRAENADVYFLVVRFEIERRKHICSVASEIVFKAEYRCAPSECLPTIPPADAWIVDPPRDGLSDEVRKNILEALPERLVYISCGPDTLARDLAQITQAYHIDSMQLFDFFPRTAHFETLTVLSRR